MPSNLTINEHKTLIIATIPVRVIIKVIILFFKGFCQVFLNLFLIFFNIYNPVHTEKIRI